MWTIFLTTFLIAGLIIAWLLGSWAVRGRTSSIAIANTGHETLTIESDDGVRIAASYWPGRTDDAPAILLLHGVGASRSATAPNAAWLASLGYAALAIDFRGHGHSTLAPRSFGWHEAADAHAAFHWLKRQQQGAPVAAIGISLGGAAALLGSAGPLPADGLILQAVYPDIRSAIRNRIASRLGRQLAHLLEPTISLQSLPRFGICPSRLTPIDGLRRFTGPTLVIGGERDLETPPDESRAMAAAAPDGTDLWIVSGAGHATVCSLDDAIYRHRVAAFLQRAIGAP